MKKFLLDSNALVNFANRRRGVYDRARVEKRSGATIGTCIPVIAETLGGALYSQTSQVNVKRVKTAIAGIRIWPFDMAAANSYAQLYADLRACGITMQPMDQMIAAIGLNLSNCTIVTCDSDFGRVPGLRVENWEV